MLDFESQWQSLMEDGAFSESATITPAKGRSFSVSGIFFSGTYEDYKPTAYSGVALEQKEWFQISSRSIPEEIDKPWQSLKGAKVSLPLRGSFKVHDVSGKRGGMLTLFIKEVES